MPKRIFIFFVFCLGFQSLSAQENADCIYLLEDAREAYEAGMVELVPELLLECIESDGLSGNEKNEAYRLVINSYLFDYLIDEADKLMDDFVEEFPEYRAGDSDPQEFVFMLESHLRAMGIDPDPYQEPEEEEAPVTVDTIVDHPTVIPVKGSDESGNSLGFLAGGNMTLPYKVEGYSLGDPASDESSFLILPGVQLGIAANLVLNKRLEASFGLQYNLSRYAYRATPLDFTTYRYKESQHQLILPISLVIKLNPQNRKTAYYLRGGIVPAYLLRATGAGTRNFEDSPDELIVENTDILDSRMYFILHAMAGAGIRIPLDNAFIFLETRVSTALLLSNNKEKRYPDNDISWVLYHVDSDFRTLQFSICAGMCWDLTR